MRVVSADGIIHPDHNRTKGDLPREGSFMRSVYDILRANYGLPVRLPLPPASNPKRAYTHRYSTIDNLRNFYGCDIWNVERNVYLLAGEWIGTHYTDYCLLRQKERDNA